MFALLLLSCSPDDFQHPVRATLDDGQVLLGAVQTEFLTLKTGMGEVDVPIADVGEVVPVEGGALSGSSGHVEVWLRDGSQLRGQWSHPELLMGLAVGGQVVPVDLPMNQLQRFQLQGGDLTPEDSVFRVRTVFGDDFLVDPELTRFSIENELGTFSPTLSEVVTLTPVADPEEDWRVELVTGTVLIGPMVEDGMTLALQLGPDEVTVPLRDLVSLQRQDWSDYDRYRNEPAEPEAAAAQAIDWRGEGGDASGEWYSNEAQRSFKATH